MTRRELDRGRSQTHVRTGSLSVSKVLEKTATDSHAVALESHTASCKNSIAAVDMDLS